MPSKTILGFLLSVFLFFSASLAQVDATKYAKLAERLSGIISREIEEKSIPAFSIALVVDQKIVFEKGFGTAKPNAATKSDRAANEHTVYRVGSVSKLFTDLALMQLVDQGKVSLDENVQKYVPEFNPQNPFDKKITLRQLMSHRSGLVRESPVGHYFDPNEPTVKATVESLNNTTLVYEPESKTKYSNAGITVVGRVLENVTGKPFETVIQEAILDPIAMSESSFDFDERVKSKLAVGQMWTYDGRTFDAPNFKLGIAPAGNLYSSVHDLSKFMMAIFNGGAGENARIISEKRFAEMVEPQFSKQKNTFGIGFALSDFEGNLAIGHGGAVYGYSTQWLAIPGKKVGVIAACSKDITNGVVSRISKFALKELVAISGGMDSSGYKVSGAVDDIRARTLVGAYQSDQGKRIEFFKRNEKLVVDLGEYTRIVRSEKSSMVCDDEFGFGPTIELSGDQELKIGNATYSRMANDKPAKPPAKWQRLFGEYGWDHNTLYVYEKHGQLWCTIEWFFQYPLKEISENVFQFPDYGLYHGEQLIFAENSGAANQVEAAKVVFKRREVGTKNGETFKIIPVTPVAELRPIARAGSPPKESGDLRKPELVELVKLDDSIKLDVRYASDNNFMNATFYSREAAFMQKPAAEALVRAHRKLKKAGYGLLIHDAYRPWFVTKMFWDATPADMKIFVANPKSGSRHNRGCAVDLTLYDLKTGKPLWMGAGYDEFSTRSFPNYPVDSSWARWHRELLRRTMESEGFSIYEFEWWHFDYKDWKSYPIMNEAFAE